MHAGAGLVTTYIPECGYTIMQTALPEAMVETDKHFKWITEIKSSVKQDVIGIGMGMGTHEDSATALEDLLRSSRSPMVLDADAVNILAQHPNLIQLLPKGSVLTPHRGELKRLLGEWSDDFVMLNMAADFSKKHRVIIVVKGAHTITVHGDKGYVNTTGNPGMATAGSGDVLSGIITGLIAQKYEPSDAAIMGVYLHGKSGDLAVEYYGYQSLVAHHLIDHLGAAYLSLFDQEEPPTEEES